MTIVNRIVLREIEAIQPPKPGDHYPVMSRCAWCDEDVAEDYAHQLPPRQYYEVIGEGLTVCEHCISRTNEE